MRRLALLLALAPAALFAQHGVGGLSNPYNSPLDVQEGALLYRSRCAVCHGPEGAGGKGTDLTTGRFRHGSSDDELFKSIADGVDGTEMPPVDLDGRRVWQLLAYVRTLSAGRAAEQASGDAAAGRALFDAKGCSNCHRVGAEGGVTGPDLTHVGARSSLAHLEASILRPSEDVRPENWFIEARLKNGERIQGRRLNEDTFTVQALTENNGLVSIDKADLEDYRVIKNSTMPSYEAKLSESELADLVAYLGSLR